MNVLIVEVERNNNGSSRLVTKEINLEKGAIQSFDSSIGGHFAELARILLKLIIEKRPSQIIFDKHGLGIGLYDSFIKELNTYSTIKIYDNGVLKY